MIGSMKNPFGSGATIKWRPATAKEWCSIGSMANSIHVSLPERQEVFDEKRRLFGDGCLVLSHDDSAVGYGVFHPWKLDNVPELDTLIGQLPRQPDCIYIHDVALLAAARGLGATSGLIERAWLAASKLGLARLALTAVHGSYPVWARQGFRAESALALSSKLANYREVAIYMTASKR